MSARLQLISVLAHSNTEPTSWQHLLLSSSRAAAHAINGPEWWPFTRRKSRPCYKLQTCFIPLCSCKNVLEQQNLLCMRQFDFRSNKSAWNLLLTSGARYLTRALTLMWWPSILQVPLTSCGTMDLLPNWGAMALLNPAHPLTDYLKHDT